MSFVHLHLHSQYSLLDGAITIDGLLKRAKETGMPSVALTDHGNLHGALEFYQKALAAEVHPVIGIEAYITQGDRRDKSHRFPTNHLVLLAENNEGLRNLFRLVTIANLEGYYYKPRMDREVLAKYSKGIIGLSACLSGVPARHLQEGRDDLAAESIEDYRRIFGEDNYFIELMDNGLPEQHPVNDGLVDLAKRLSVPMVATNDCHYLNQEDARAHDLLLCIGTGKTVADEDRMRFHSDQFYVKSPDEMKAIFSPIPEAISNTVSLAQRCKINLDLSNYHMPRFDVPDGQTVDSYLAHLAESGLEQRMPRIAAHYKRAGKPLEGLRERYHERLALELSTIQGTGFSGYFLIVSDFINHAKQANIPVGPGRGSAAGSLVAYALRITDIDPIPYQLLFERFLNSERVSMPDIDVDFCQDGRDSVISYVAEKYGCGDAAEDTRVAQITTFGKMQARAVIRDVGRVMGLAYGEVDRIAKLVPSVLNITLEEAFKQEPKFTELRKKDPRLDELLRVAVSLEGLTRHASVHAAGVVISDDRPLIDHLPLSKGTHDEIVTQWDMKGVEKIGLIKFDFLGLKTLTLLRRAVDMVREGSGQEIDLLDLDLFDPAVFEMLGHGDAQGIFQLESSGMRDLLVKMKPSSFEDIIALVALYRPGPLGSGMVDDFINRKHGRTAIQYDLPQLEGILKDTYGVILYQEQVMQIAALLANYSLAEADLLRRAMGKKIASEMEQQEERFMEGCQKNKVPKGKAHKVFDLMAKFSGYGFNKSHSAAYALIAFQTAYMKVHHPREFMAACLSIDRGNTDRVVMLMNDCRNRGIEVLPPDVNESALDFRVVEDRIRFGLAAVKNVGEGAIEAIIRAREDGHFISLFDFCDRVDLRTVNRRVIESLIKCGAFDSTEVSRPTMQATLGKAMERAAGSQRDRLSGQTSLFDVASSQSEIAVSYLEVPEWPEPERLRYEKETVGFYITGHPLLRFGDTLRRYGNSDIASLSQIREGQNARIGGIVAHLKEITTKRGDRMAFARLEDLTGSVELILFADLYREKSALFKGDDPIFVVGTLDVGEEQSKILVTGATAMDEASSLFKGQIQITVDTQVAKDKMFSELKEVLRRHRGECPTVLRLQIPKRSETVLSLSEDYAASPSDQLLKEISGLLGGAGSVDFV